ncbi:hypothetical protein C0J52_08950 [Blattella germanica]|nr:hypothetical protein C0J52_08950 [Blattella germanica]
MFHESKKEEAMAPTWENSNVKQTEINEHTRDSTPLLLQLNNETTHLLPRSRMVGGWYWNVVDFDPSTEATVRFVSLRASKYLFSANLGLTEHNSIGYYLTGVICHHATPSAAAHAVQQSTSVSDYLGNDRYIEGSGFT